MQWLTAILAFATTMFIFSIIVSTIVETIHRFWGSRPFGLIKMLEHLYDDVIASYLTRGSEEIGRRQFIDEMIRIRPANGSTPAPNDKVGGGAVEEGTPSTMLLKSWNMLARLPVEMFMERLGASKFSAALEKNFEEGSEKREQVLKYIAQKFELYGQEAGIHFERKARSWSVAVAMLVAWIFYVHPHELIHTYLQQPEVAAAVADLHDDALKQFNEIEKKLVAPAKPAVPADGAFLEQIREELETARKELEPLKTAGAPIGWSKDNKACLGDVLRGASEPAAQQGTAKAGDGPVDKTCWVNVPDNVSDFIWLLLGGLLVGLGAPFWAKSVRQIVEVRKVSENITEILKPEMQAQSVVTQQVAAAGADVPTTSKAFDVAAAGKKRETQRGQQDNP